MRDSTPGPPANKPEIEDLPETTTYLPASHPSSLAFRAALGGIASGSPPKSAQPDSTPSQPWYFIPVTLPAQSQTSSTAPSTALPIEGPAPLPAPVAEAATTTCDPTKLTTWGPKTYTYTAGGESKEDDKATPRKGRKGKKEKEAKTTENGYLINPPSPTNEDESSAGPPPSTDSDVDEKPVSTPKRKTRDKGPKTSTVTVRGSEESTTSETVEVLDGGAVRKTWVTLVRIVVVEEESGEGVGGAPADAGAAGGGGTLEMIDGVIRRRTGS